KNTVRVACGNAGGGIKEQKQFLQNRFCSLKSL
ncbi:MAG: hypothetical protein ACI9JY_000988, partial [Saprospiraceae bacterium]